MDENNINLDKITDGVISYLEFLKKFNEVKLVKSNAILSESNNNADTRFSYLFCDYEIDCYIIDKKIFDAFCLAINFNEFKSILDTINQKSKNKFKEKLNQYLKENPFNFNESKIKFYSKEEEMKEIVKNLHNYSYVNKELLINGMGINVSQLEGHLIKSFRNENNLSLLFTSNNFIITINEEKNKILNNKHEKYKNLYYVDDITKKIFILLHFHEKKMVEKLKTKIKNVYKFKKYYLINKNWLKEYKEYFLYDLIIKKLDEKYENYSYEKIKFNLDNLSKNEIGQIILYRDTNIPEDLREDSDFKCDIKKIYITELITENKKDDINQETIEPEERNTFIDIPNDFELINEDIYELFTKEEFFYDKIEKHQKEIFYEILFGNNQIIIKNKINVENEDDFLNCYLIYVYNKENQNEDKYSLKYILDYENNSLFFPNFKKIIEKGLNNYISKNGINIDNINCEQKIFDDKKNILGKFVNIGIKNKEEIINMIDCKYNIINDTIIKQNKMEDKYTQTNIIEKNEFLSSNKNNVDEIDNNSENNKNENNTVLSNELINEKQKKKEIFDLKNFNNETEINDFNDYTNDKKNESSFIKDESKIKTNYLIEEIITDEPEDIDINIQINNTNANSKHSNIDNNINYSDNSIPDFNKLKIKMNIVEPYLKEIYKPFKIDKNNKNLELKLLIPDEIIEKKESPDIFRILLIKEKYYKEAKSLIKYDLINNYINAKEKEKNELLRNNLEEFQNIIKIIKKKLDIPQKISLIETYDEITKHNNDNQKFFILYNYKFYDIYIKAKDIFIYYFKYNEKSYIFFEKEKQILELIPNEDEEKSLYTLKEYEKDELELLKLIKLEIDKNKKISDLNEDDYINRDIKEYYLINNKWIDLNIDYEAKKNIKPNNFFSYNKKYLSEIKPKLNEYLDYLKYPLEFDFLEKEKTEYIFNDLVKKGYFIILDDILINKLFFVKWQNNIPKTQEKNFDNFIYIGIIDNEKKETIYFYLYSNKKYNFEFIMQFNEQEIVCEEIKYIKQKGIGQYLEEIEVDFSKKNQSYDLINNDFKYIGYFINFNAKQKNLYSLNCSRDLKHIENSEYLIGILLCLFNLESFLKIFHYKSELVNLIDEDSMFTKYFYEINKDLWSIDDKESNTNLYTNLMKEILKSNNINIFKDIKALIELLLLELHDELKTDNNGKKIKKKSNLHKNNYEINDNFFSENISDIKKLFFIDIELERTCRNCHASSFNIIERCTLVFDLEQIKLQNLEQIDINNILDCTNENEGDYHKCKCNSQVKSNTKFYHLPKYLIIIIKRKENEDIKFSIEKSFNIDIKKYMSRNAPKIRTYYELVSLIQNNINTICKSNYENEWYKFDGKHVMENMSNKKFNIKKNTISVPYLLIYQNKYMKI